MSEPASDAADVARRAAAFGLVLDASRCAEIGATAAHALQIVRGLPLAGGNGGSPPLLYENLLRQCAAAQGEP